MPFDVTRCYDEATQYADPRIWTAERDIADVGDARRLTPRAGRRLRSQWRHRRQRPSELMHERCRAQGRRRRLPEAGVRLRAPSRPGRRAAGAPPGRGGRRRAGRPGARDRPRAARASRSCCSTTTTRLSTGSRAICFAKRTLEIFDRLGCGDRMVDKGVSWNVGKVFFKRRAGLQLRPAAGGRATSGPPSSTCSSTTSKVTWPNAPRSCR